MNERCTFFRLPRDQAKQLFACRTPEALRAFVAELDPAASLEGGATALVLHRVLTNGTLEPEAGDYPLNHAVLGGRVLGHETGFAVILKRPDMCPHIAEGLSKIKPETVESSLAQLAAAQPDACAGIQSSDVALLLARLVECFQAAASAGEAVILVRQTLP
jgi:hypothetical protein